MKLPWELTTFYSSVLSDDDEEMSDDEERGAYADQLQRLKVADDLTRNMSKDEYMYYSECRQASFTFKKAKRFKEWCQLGQYVV